MLESRSDYVGPTLRTELTGMRSRALAFCALLLIGALYVVGIVSEGVVRHIVQTAPVWLTVVLALRRSGWSKWTALPCFLFWLFLMTLIWLFLLGWAHVVSGSFSPIEIAMTLVVGLCSVVGVVLAARMKTEIRAVSASTAFLAILILQLLAFRISLLPSIAHDWWR
jgi:hypothetical protein